MIRFGEVDRNFMVWAKKQGLNTTRQHEALAWCWVEVTTEIIYQLWLAGAGVVEANQRRGIVSLGVQLNGRRLLHGESRDCIERSVIWS